MPSTITQETAVDQVLRAISSRPEIAFDDLLKLPELRNSLTELQIHDAVSELKWRKAIKETRVLSCPKEKQL